MVTVTFSGNGDCHRFVTGLAKVVAIASVSAIVEAVSPHGWDNLTMPLVPSALAWSWLA